MVTDKSGETRHHSPCPLCGSESVLHKALEKVFLCSLCALLFKDETLHLTPFQEKERYSLHNNCVDDPAYQSHLKKITTPLCHKLLKASSGLDFGCGPGPAVSFLMEKEGHTCLNYDPFFYPQDLRNMTFDFITSTEAVEHFYYPRKEFEFIFQKLKPKAWLAIMTQLYPEDVSASWWYLRDPTHVVFYNKTTFQWIAQNWACQYEVLGDNIILIQKMGD